MTADPGYRTDPDLKIAFDYLGALAEGDRMEIVANRKVQRLSSIGSAIELPGEVISVRRLEGECVMMLDAQANRQDRIAGETVVPGKFVFGPQNKVYQYTPATPAKFAGTTTGVKTIVVSTSDAVKLTLQYSAAQTITLTAGVGVAMQAIADELNASLVGMTAYVDTAGHLCVMADEIWKSITIDTVANDAYTLLGWTATNVYVPSAPSHDASAVAGMILVGGDADDAVETLEY